MLAVIFFCLCILAAVRDLASLTIDNPLNAAIALLVAPAALSAGVSFEMFAMHLGVGFIAFAISFLLFQIGVFGGGDAKMIPAVLLWIGPAGVVDFLAGMAVSGGILVLFLIMGRAAVPMHAAPAIARASFDKGAGAPYGIAIAAGALYAAPASLIITELLK